MAIQRRGSHRRVAESGTVKSVFDIVFHDPFSVDTTTMRNARLDWIASLAFFALLSAPLHAGEQSARVRILHAPSTVRGTIGGEAHDSYAYVGRKGEHLVVRLDWKTENGPDGANVAELTLSAAGFDDAKPLASGIWSKDGRQWQGALQRDGKVYLYVVAHPSARYTLSIRRQLPMRH